MAKLHRLLEQAASTSAVKMTLWGSNVQKLDLATDRYVHAGRETEKKFESVSGIKYYPALYHVAEALFQILDKQEPMLKRRFGYHLKETEFSAIQAERIWMDIALTIREHPFALGVVSDSEGMFSTPSGWQLEVVRCVNILQYLNSDKDGDVPPGCQKMVLRNTSAEAIPSTIVRLDLRSSSGSGVDPLRAVVVMEHRNAKMTIDIASRKGKGNFKGVLFVLVIPCPGH